MIKEKIIPHYEMDFYGARLQLCDLTIYIEEKFLDQEFTVDLPHKIPRHEMARAAVVNAAIKGDLISLESEDISNGILDMYTKACLKELSLNNSEQRKVGVERILKDLKSLRTQGL